MIERKTLKLALETLEETRNALAWFYDSYPQDVTKKGEELLPHVETVLTAIREALAQPETLPWTNKMSIDVPNQPLYTAPQRKPLTDEEIRLQWSEFWETECHPWAIEFARAIEAAHGIKEKNT